MADHTPGPWIYDPNRREIRHQGVVMARIPIGITKMEQREFPINARAMAEAPEMLAILLAVYEDLGGEHHARAKAVIERMGCLTAAEKESR